ncbi:MAG: hypothetical protein JSR17_06340 [Proteobacteria bacterium]|nr:hypothetical protein [Pseudomonadota bacterium]
MKKKNTNGEGIVWPPTYAKDIKENQPKSHHEQENKDPGSDHHHGNDSANEADKRRVWEEKNKQNLPPKNKKGP